VFPKREPPRNPKTTQSVKSIIRCASVVIAICSWITVSNHCAFAAVASEMNNQASDCPFHSKPAKQKDPSPQVQCCKSLRAVVAAQSKPWGHDHAKFSDANFPVETGAFVLRPLRSVARLLLDTGPPLHPFSFAELILQHSLLAHAPPSVA
jgi:hypothetical protein